MEFLAEERRTLESFLPGLDDELGSIALDQLESRGSNAIELFRQAGGPGLFVPEELQGHGADPVQGIQVQRALASRSPSLAVATTMHHFSTAGLVELWHVEKGMEALLLQAIAGENKLLASGFAEGVRGQGIFSPTMRGRRVNGQVLVTGSKKPCSLSRSMDVLTASIVVTSDEPGTDDELGIAIIPADLPGIEVSPFWSTPVLAGAQSDAISLTDVALDPDLVITVGTEADELDHMQTAGLLWFEVLITASYIGMASALVDRVLREGRGEAGPRLGVAVELEAAMSSVEGVAHRMIAGDKSPDLLSKALICRFAAQDAIGRSVASAVEQLGGMAFIGAEDVNYFASASRALAFHPPGRMKTAGSIAESLSGAELEIA